MIWLLTLTNPKQFSYTKEIMICIWIKISQLTKKTLTDKVSKFYFAVNTNQKKLYKAWNITYLLNLNINLSKKIKNKKTKNKNEQKNKLVKS